MSRAVQFSTAYLNRLTLYTVLSCLLPLRYESTISADGMLLHNIAFEYTADSAISISDRRVVAAFGRTVGVPVVTDCTNSGTLPSGVTGGNYARTQNCATEFVPNAVNNNCGLPNECATLSVTGSNGCCGPVLSQPVPEASCSFGLLCTGSVEKVNATIANQPNSRVLCTSERCGCTTRYISSVPECVSTAETESCFYNRELCYSYCGGLTDGGGGTGTHRQHYTLGAGMALTPLRITPASTEPTFYQDWQYSAVTTQIGSIVPEGGGWYAIRDSYFNKNDEATVSYVRGVGYGQYVWTVRRSNCTVSVSDLLLPSELNVEARLLPTTSEQTDVLDTITVIPTADSGSTDGIYASTMKLVSQSTPPPTSCSAQMPSFV